MNKIDTEYATLADVPQSVVQYYEEETRTRITGYTEPDEEGNSTPITEEYIVVALNKPDVVLYSEVTQRIGERKPRDVVNAELARAIEWEEFYYGHDLTLRYEKMHPRWVTEEPMIYGYEDEVEYELAHREWVELEPQPPAIDPEVRRGYYEVITPDYNTNTHNPIGVTDTYNDELYTTTKTFALESKPTEVVAEYHSELAIETRFDAVYAPLETTHGLIDVGRGKDSVLGIDNVKDAIAGYEAGMVSIGSVMWIMTDNSVAELTIADLRQVIIDFNIRKQVTFMQYGQWRETDRQLPFVCE
ncbi:hypothetical protein NVP1259O_09 [Vibrio phage 1.259.O._10N.286.48.F4]|nr:hypothetical protein NVP1259O_09 [Vibrio phage 1.259.O._10N.286.48.F4]